MNNTENLGTRLKKLRTENGLSQAKLAKTAGVTQGLIGQLESGLNSGSKHLYKIAATLNVTVDWLVTGKGEMSTHAPAQWDANVAPITSLHPVPIISWVRAGAFSDIEEFTSEDFVQVDVSTSTHAFALQVAGDSMTTSNNRGVSFPDGMVIVVDPDKAAVVGDYVIIKDVHKQAATFKQYMTDGISHKGVPLNKDYDTVDLDDERYRIIGVVVEAVHRMKF
jgi:SOS-response transcriptional repressor LexA